jgi:hypothetical protein
MQVILDDLKFDSFGNITAQSNSANQPLPAYTGQMFDSDTGENRDAMKEVVLLG